VKMSQQLQDEGWFVPAIRPPTVPEGTSRFRMSLMVDHRPDDIVAVLNQIAELSR
jgi:8-amino-7-oxononanoate synthase